MTKSFFWIGALIIAAGALFSAACNVPPQQPMKTTGALFAPQTLRTTPFPCGPDKSGNLQPCEAVNYILTNGPRSAIDASWTFPGTPPSTQTTNIPGTYNTLVSLDQPVIFANDCDLKKIQYTMTWAMLDENGQDFQTTPVTAFAATTPGLLTNSRYVDVTKATALTTEVGVNYVLRLHVSGMDQCSRISFKFDALEIPGYQPPVAPLNVSTDPTNPQPNVAQPKVGFLPEFTEDFQITPTANQNWIVANQSFTASPCDPNQAQFSFSWVTTNQTGQQTVAPIKNIQTDSFATDKTQKSHALRVRVSNIKECRRAAFAFAVVPGPNPSPSPAPSPTAAPVVTAPATPLPVLPAPSASPSLSAN